MQRTDGARPGWRRGGIAGVVLAGVLLRPMDLGAAQPLALEDVIARVSAYVWTFVEEFSTVVTEEDYRQSNFSRSRTDPVRVQLRSEFLLVRIAGADAWTGFRDIFEVNGRRVRDRQDRLAALFIENTSTAVEQARRIVAESTRYNLGSTHRTFNIPTYALSFLLPANVTRFEFEKDGEGCGDLPSAWRIRYEEVEHPTLTRGFQNISLPSQGRFCVDPDSGTVLETEIRLSHPSVGRDVRATDASAEVRFALDANVNLWVPVEMRESYTERRGGRTSSTARYANYRKFSIAVSENTDPGPD